MSEPVTLQDIYDLFRTAQQESERRAAESERRTAELDRQLATLSRSQTRFLAVIQPSP